MSILNSCSRDTLLTAARGVAIAGVCSLALSSNAVFANHTGDGPEVPAELIEGNPSCAYYGYAYEARFEDYYSTGLVGGNHPDGPMNVDIILTENKTFTWVSHNSLVHAVIVKGGPNANGYLYSLGNGDTTTGEVHDDGLHAPNSRSGNRAGLSHISFCYTPVLPDPDIKVTKDCRDGPPTPVNGGADGAIYTYDVKVENTGDGALNNFMVTEALDGHPQGDGYVQCEIVAPAANAVAISGQTAIPNLSLAEGADVTLVVECHAPQPLAGKANFIKITADTEYAHEPMVMDDSSSTCDDLAPPNISIEKDCGNPMIRLVEVEHNSSTILGVQACVDITVRNDGLVGIDENLTDIWLTDDIALGAPLLLKEANDVDNLVLSPQESHTETFCYFPEAPTGYTLGESNGLTWYSIFTVFDPNHPDSKMALFSNTASVVAAGEFSGTGVGPESDDADCSICYSNNTTDFPAECPPGDMNPYPVPGLLD